MTRNDAVRYCLTTPEFLKCLEAILGVLNPCLPVLKPDFDKVHNSLRRIGSKEGTNISWRSRSIPLFMRMSGMWGSRSERGFGMETLTSMDEFQRNERGGLSAITSERTAKPKASEIHVRIDVNVESVCSND